MKLICLKRALWDFDVIQNDGVDLELIIKICRCRELKEKQLIFTGRVLKRNMVETITGLCLEKILKVDELFPRWRCTNFFVNLGHALGGATSILGVDGKNDNYSNEEMSCQKCVQQAFRPVDSGAGRLVKICKKRGYRSDNYFQRLCWYQQRVDGKEEVWCVCIDSIHVGHRYVAKSREVPGLWLYLMGKTCRMNHTTEIIGRDGRKNEWT